MSPKRPRLLAIGTFVFLAVMIAMIAWAYSVAEHRVH